MKKYVVFYAVTLSAQDKETFLVTGNGKHFPKKPFVVTPAELVEIMQNENEFIGLCLNLSIRSFAL